MHIIHHDLVAAPEQTWCGLMVQGETLKIVMAPQRTRTTINFEQRPSQGGQDGSLPRLTLFEHVAGARVLADLFPFYRLPNGKKAYYYYDAGWSLSTARNGDTVHLITCLRFT